MIKRVLSVGLLGICLIAFVGNQAFAATVSCPSSCLVKIFGVLKCTCTSTGGSLICGIQGSGFGNDWQVGGDDTFLGCEASATDWMVLCENNGGNVAVGTSTVKITGTTEGIMEVAPWQVDEKGKVTVEVHSSLDAATLTLLNNYSNEACPGGTGDNWRIKDGVPSSMILTYVAKDAWNCVMADANFDCELPDYENLDVDPVTKTFEKRIYDCTAGSKHHYSCP
jgi:hypothetical protein